MVGQQKEFASSRQVEHSRRLEIDDQLKLCRLFDR
jgi:hypothetical protein